MKTELPIVVAALIALYAAVIVYRRDPENSLLGRPFSFLMVWLAIFLLPYYAFGPSSFLWMDEEGDLLVPHHLYLARYQAGGLYSHLLGSGGDLVSSFLIGGEMLSPERLLFAHLPMWLAILVHKALTCVFGFAGTYLVVRRMGGCDRALALGLAAIATVSYHRMVIVTYGTGMTLSLVALGVYAIVGRFGAPRWWLGVAGYSVLAAFWTNPNEGTPAIGAAVLAAAILQRRFHLKMVVGLLAVMTLVALNWAEALYGMVQIMGESARATVPLDRPSLWEAFVLAFSEYSNVMVQSIRLHCALAVVVLTVAAFCCRDLAFRFVAALLLPGLLYAAFFYFPWEALGAAGVRSASMGYVLYAAVTIIALAAAQLAVRLGARAGIGRFQPRFGLPAWVVVTAAFAAVGWYTSHSLSVLLHRSGQAHYRVPNLVASVWADAEPFRSVIPRGAYLSPEPNVLFGAYGLSPFDAWLNLVNRRHAEYWRQGVLRQSRSDYRISFSWGSWREGLYHLGEAVDFRLLAVANVGYVVSALPLEAPELRLLDGPATPPLDKPRNAGLDKRIAFYEDRVSRIFDIGKLYIYRLDDALPRVYGARGVVVVPDDAPVGDMLAKVAEEGLHRHAVVRQRYAGELPETATLQVSAFRLVENGFDIDVDAPDGGTVLVNAAATRHFEATVNGRPAPIIEANGIQMAVPIAAGASRVLICYRRPTLFPVLHQARGPCG